VDSSLAPDIQRAAQSVEISSFFIVCFIGSGLTKQLAAGTKPFSPAHAEILKP
jgi:hypothetical protein